MKNKKIIALSLGAVFGLSACGFSACGLLTPNSGTSQDSSSSMKDTVLVDYEKYKEERDYKITAWDFPYLEYSQTTGYDTEKNNQLMKDIKDAGFDVLNLTGYHSLYINSEENIERTKEQIALANKNGLQTVVFGSNTTESNENCVFTDKYPDFSECEGFYGFMPWDEPYESVMSKLGLYADTFNNVYKNTDAKYFVNLLPSYASLFSSGGYGHYLETYCETVLSRLEGEKWLMVDSYPVMEDGTLMTNFLYDLMMLKVYAQNNDAYAHMCLMATATGDKLRTPSKEELYTQVYTALAFGMNAYSWYTYSTPRELQIPDGAAAVMRDGTKTATYDAVKEVNQTVKSFGYVYNCFEWKGIMLGSDRQGAAMNVVSRDRNLRDWVLSTDETTMLASVECENDYIIGIMEDELSNEGFMIANYSDRETSADIDLELVFNGANYLRVYKQGVAEDVALEDGAVTLSLDYGEGAFVIPYYKG